jgi:hypothetical protein
MENYQPGIKLKDMNYIPRNYGKESFNSNYSLGEYRQKYLNISTAQGSYNDFMRNLPRGSHIGKYQPLK